MLKPRHALGAVGGGRFAVRDKTGKVVVSGDTVDGSPLAALILKILAANAGSTTHDYTLQWFPTTGGTRFGGISQADLDSLSNVQYGPPPAPAPNPLPSPTPNPGPVAPVPASPIVVVFTVTDSTGAVIYSGSVNQAQLNTLIGSSLVMTSPGTYTLVAGPTTYPLSPSGLLALQNLVNGATSADAAAAAAAATYGTPWYQNTPVLIGGGIVALLLIIALRK